MLINVNINGVAGQQRIIERVFGNCGWRLSDALRRGGTAHFGTLAGITVDPESCLVCRRPPGIWMLGGTCSPPRCCYSCSNSFLVGNIIVHDRSDKLNDHWSHVIDFRTFVCMCVELPKLIAADISIAIALGCVEV